MQYTSLGSLMECLAVHGQNLLCCTQEVGDSVYLPYGRAHCVVTLGNISPVASLLSVGLRVPKERTDQTWKAVAMLLPLAGERTKKCNEGPRCTDFER